MKVLLTGGTGFVGINLVEHLLDNGHDVVIYAATPFVEDAERSFRERSGSYEFIQGDINDELTLRSLFEKYNFESCIHGAVITPDIEREKRMSKKIIEVNLMGTVRALEMAKEFQLKKFIYMSSVSVYGSQSLEVDKLHEDSSYVDPVSLYEITKYAADRISERYRELFEIPVVVARIGHVFGPWEHDTGLRDTLSAPFQALQLASQGEKATLPREGLRDWVYSRDVAGALIALLEADQLKHSVYHIGSGNRWTVAEWCELLKEEFPNFSYEVNKQSEGNIRLFLPSDPAEMSINRLVDENIFKPTFDMRKAFTDYTEWVKSKEKFWI